MRDDKGFFPLRFPGVATEDLAVSLNWNKNCKADTRATAAKARFVRKV